MRIVGRVKEPKITYHATAENLKRGCEFNDSLSKFFKSKLFIPKGVYCYKTHEEANEHWEKFMIKGIVERQKEIEKNGRIIP